MRFTNTLFLGTAALQAMVAPTLVASANSLRTPAAVEPAVEHTPFQLHGSVRHLQSEADVVATAAMIAEANRAVEAQAAVIAPKDQVIADLDVAKAAASQAAADQRLVCSKFNEKGATPEDVEFIALDEAHEMFIRGETDWDVKMNEKSREYQALVTQCKVYSDLNTTYDDEIRRWEPVVKDYDAQLAAFAAGKTGSMDEQIANLDKIAKQFDDALKPYASKTTPYDVVYNEYNAVVKGLEAEAAKFNSLSTPFDVEAKKRDTIWKEAQANLTLFDTKKTEFDIEVARRDALVKALEAELRKYDTKTTPFDSGIAEVMGRLNAAEAELKKYDAKTTPFDQVIAETTSKLNAAEAELRKYDAKTTPFDPVISETTAKLNAAEAELKKYDAKTTSFDPVIAQADAKFKDADAKFNRASAADKTAAKAVRDEANAQLVAAIAAKNTAKVQATTVRDDAKKEATAANDNKLKAKAEATAVRDNAKKEATEANNVKIKARAEATAVRDDVKKEVTAASDNKNRARKNVDDDRILKRNDYNAALSVRDAARKATEAIRNEKMNEYNAAKATRDAAKKEKDAEVIAQKVLRDEQLKMKSAAQKILEADRAKVRADLTAAKSDKGSAKDLVAKAKLEAKGKIDAAKAAKDAERKPLEEAKAAAKLAFDDAKKARDAAKKTASDAENAARTRRDDAKKACYAIVTGLDKKKKETFDAWKLAKDDATKAHAQMKALLKTLNEYTKKHNAIVKSLEKLKKKKENDAKKLAPKTTKEVATELVAGYCVADHVCASIRGDPHITTFDGSRYDCQGEGEFILAKAINSASTFQIQARFKDTKRASKISVTQAVSITTGVRGEPDLDVFTEVVNGKCVLYYFVDGNATDFKQPVPGIAFQSMSGADYIFYTGSGIMYTVSGSGGNFGCVLNSKICLPPSMVEKEDIVGLLGSPDGLSTNEWTTRSGAQLSQARMDKPAGYAYCTKHWCVDKPEDSIFGYLPGTSWNDFYNCGAPYDNRTDAFVLDPPAECEACCADVPDPVLHDDCIEECSVAEEGARMKQCVIDIEDGKRLSDVEKKCKDPLPVPKGPPTAPPTEAPTKLPAPPTQAPVPPTDAPVPPTGTPTGSPTGTPTGTPTARPSGSPTGTPTARPTGTPTGTPTTLSPVPPTGDRTRVCPTDTKTCPDGTVLSRIAPDCEFKDCPTPDSGDDSSDDKVYTKGDPHFKTFGGEFFDFHGECDLVLLKNPLFKDGLGMEIHIRTKITDWWSSVQAAVIQIGDDTLEIQAGNLDRFLWVNGVENEDPVEGKVYKTQIAGFLVRYKKLGPGVEAFIYLDGPKEVVMLKTFKDFVRVDIDWKESENYYGASGLLGSYDLKGQRVGRDGRTYMANHDAFGQEWQVNTEDPLLFHSYEGAVLPPNKCIMPEDNSVQAARRKRRLAESNLTREAIEKACGHLHSAAEREGCEFDVIATQDIAMASVW